MAYVKGIVSGRIHKCGKIIAETRDLEVMDTSKPADPIEAIKAGMDLEAAEQIKARVEGPFEFVAYFGGATAFLVPFGSLALLDERRMRHLRKKYYERDVFPPSVAIMHVRNMGAPAVQSAAEPSGGMAETADLLWEQVKEIVEIGVWNQSGCARFILPPELKQHQSAFDKAQYDAWQALCVIRK